MVIEDVVVHVPGIVAEDTSRAAGARNVDGIRIMNPTEDDVNAAIVRVTGIDIGLVEMTTGRRGPKDVRNLLNLAQKSEMHELCSSGSFLRAFDSETWRTSSLRWVKSEMFV